MSHDKIVSMLNSSQKTYQILSITDKNKRSNKESYYPSDHSTNIAVHNGTLFPGRLFCNLKVRKPRTEQE